MKYTLILAAIFSLSLLSAKDKGTMTKIVQTKIFIKEKSEELPHCINEWLVENKIRRDDLISTQFDSSGGYRRVFVVYEIDYEDKK